MPSAIIDIENIVGAQVFDITLDGIDIVLEVYYSERSNSWYLNIREPNTNDLIQGATRITANYPIYFQADEPRLPAGQIIAVTGSEPPSAIRLRDLGDTGFLYYASPDDNPPPPSTAYAISASEVVA